jgi:hypothetical protein
MPTGADEEFLLCRVSSFLVIKTGGEPATWGLTIPSTPAILGVSWK